MCTSPAAAARQVTIITRLTHYPRRSASPVSMCSRLYSAAPLPLCRQGRHPGRLRASSAPFWTLALLRWSACLARTVTRAGRSARPALLLNHFNAALLPFSMYVQRMSAVLQYMQSIVVLCPLILAVLVLLILVISSRRRDHQYKVCVCYTCRQTW